MTLLTLDGGALSLEKVRTILRGRVRLKISPGALNRVRKSREIVERAMGRGETLYGINTGFGKLAETHVEAGHLEELQRNLLLSHAVGLGDRIPDAGVGLLIVLTLQGLLSGHSGVSVELVQRLTHLFNSGVRPEIHDQGSVGASGDLSPHAELGCALLQGPRPYRFKAKEALSLINGTQFTAAILGRVLVESIELVKLADIAGAMSLEALRGSVKPFDARVHRAKPHPGQMAVAENLRALLRGSRILESHRNCAKVQDAYALRCIPQVHGAVRDALTYASEVWTREVNASTDNPLVFENGEIISAGNFHGQALAIAADALALALVSLANISERRIDRMTNPDQSELPPFLVVESGLNSGYMMVQVAAAALAAECRAEASPASVHSIPTGGSKEDHVPMAPLAARKCARVLEGVRKVLGLEILCAAQGLDIVTLRPGRGVAAAHRCVRSAIPHLARDRGIRRESQQVVEPEFLRRVLGAVERRTRELL